MTRISELTRQEFIDYIERRLAAFSKSPSDHYADFCRTYPRELDADQIAAARENPQEPPAGEP